MLLSGRLMCPVAAVAVLLCLLVPETAAEKIFSCCTRASSERITVPILGYRMQHRDPPCVKAVIFETAEGPICSHWQEKWVFEQVKKLEATRKLQALSEGSEHPTRNPKLLSTLRPQA